ncbi:MAG TPA: dTMP kinase [Gemmataceae bacterium]|nr:dTMP kinase [Gemmataceae bacterium]
MARPLFISLDGLDGCGKSTQARLLANWLRCRGHAVTECADPGGTQTGDQIRDVVLHCRYAVNVRCEALLFMASRAQLVSEVIAPALAAGQIVVSDRYVLANVVYQGYGGGLAPTELWQVGRFSTAGLEPDLTLVLDLPVAVARARRVRPPDRLESRDDAFHQRVREGFLAEARLQAERIKVIDATQSVEAVHDQVCHAVARLMHGGQA